MKCHFKVSTVSNFDKRRQADAIIVPFWQSDKAVEAFQKSIKIPESRSVISMKDFKGKKGELFFLYPEKSPEKRIILLGLGKKQECTTYTLREAYHHCVKACNAKEVVTVNIVMPEVSKIKDEVLAQTIAETLILSNYSFLDLKVDTLKDHPKTSIASAQFISSDPDLAKVADKALKLCRGIYLTRDLINQNADDLTPEKLADIAKAMEKTSSKIKVTVFDKKKIEAEKMSLLLAVNRGSNLEPRFIIAKYKGNPSSKDHFALVGKGVTYDTGGLSLKPTNAMLGMKSDMGGAATVLGALYAAANLNLKINLTVVIPSTENSIGSKSYKVGDVYPAYSGKTVEITNTDAEGRLILADALAYTEKKLKPNGIINLATLTGGVVVALGDEIAGFFSNHDTLSERLTYSAKVCDELLWRLPLQPSYLKMLESKIADIKNSAGREASAMQGGLFLQQFVENTPWAHIDIAGTAYLDKPKNYSPIFATGYGVRTLIHLLENLSFAKDL